MQAMFPTVEPAVIEAVLETHAGSSQDERFEKALGDLLQLTDPDYKVSPSCVDRNPDLFSRLNNPISP